MADLSAVLRKTIDGLPSATPQLRAKVYEKARTAIGRQIAAANPPLADDVVEARQRALEEAIASTEAHYAGLESGASAAPEPAPAPRAEIPAAPVPQPAREVAPPPPAPREVAPPSPPSPRETVPEQAAPVPPVAAAPFVAPVPVFAPPPIPAQPPRSSVPAEPAEPASSEPAERIGEIGPLSHPPVAAEAEPAAPETPVGGPPIGFHQPHAGDAESSDRFGFGDPQAGVAAPGYAGRRETRSRRPLYIGLASLLFVGGAGALAYVYTDEIRSVLTGPSQIAATGTPPAATDDVGTTDAPESASTEALEAPGPEPEPPSGPAAEGAEPPAAASPTQRQFTQRLLPDGTEVDEGPAAEAPNAFDEGTDVAAASLVPQEQNPPAPEAGAPTAETETAAVAPPGDPAAVPVGQRAVFYEERSATQPGSQHGGNVVWSVVNEPPADGQPAEPAIRAVADVPGENLRLTMTIRRNADATLPASHVIELMFDVPNDFEGGEVANVQRLALKPTEQARGEPLIGVAGKISDGFFIIALNDLQQAVDSNLNLMSSQEWIDIPLAYSTGQRALMSLEKGIPGERVFKEAMEAWATRT